MQPAGSSALPFAGGTAGCGSSCWSGPVPSVAPAAGRLPPPGSCPESPPSRPAARQLHPEETHNKENRTWVQYHFHSTIIDHDVDIQHLCQQICVSFPFLHQ